MIVDYLNYIVSDLVPRVFNFLNSCQIAPGVSILSFSVAMVVIGIVVGAILLRV